MQNQQLAYCSPTADFVLNPNWQFGGTNLAQQVREITGGLPMLVIREGRVADELLALLEEDPRISILVLASAAGAKGPGPLITALTGKLAARLSVPLTIVPGTMTDQELDRVT